MAQDTVRISLPEFLDRAMRSSAVVKARSVEVEQADMRYRQARAQRVLPRFDATSNHGLVPGIRTDSSRSRAFLDPNLENDWSKWGIFTRIEFQGIQPLFAWGALSKGVDAALQAAKAAEYDFQFKRTDLALRAVEVYNARLLDVRLRGVLRNAEEQFDKAEKTLNKMKEDGEDVDQGELYRFRISRLQFQQKRMEFIEQMASVERIWNLLLGEDARKSVILPQEPTIEAVQDTLRSYEEYVELALSNRADLRSVGALKKAAESAYLARKAQRYPALFFGFGGEFVNTPRPVQQQPLIGDRYTYLNLYYSLGFRQSLNFNVMRFDVNRSFLDVKRARESEAALREVVQLELSDSYRAASLLKFKYQTAAQALQTSKEWVRMEQIDYDLGVGELRKLVDAVKTNLELDAEAAKLVYDYNVEYARLLKTAGVLDQTLFKSTQ